MEDYYALLGVDRDADQGEIKRAFRKLARETHPDANPDDPHAEERFRKVAQAYEVLSDPNRRAAYDRGGEFDMSDLFSSFAGIDDLLSRFFGSAGGFGGFPFGGQTVGPAQGSDVGVRVEISLADAAAGIEREVSYRTAVACETCQGSGTAPGVPLETCDRCGGQGSVRLTRQTLLGTTMTIAPCDRCRGRGRVITEPCDTCSGVGSMAGERSMAIEIPSGIEDGARLRVPGKGAAGEPGGRPGDLYVEVRVAPDDRFERHGPDLIHRLHVGLAEATLGASRAVPLVEGDDYTLDIPAGTQPGSVFKLARMGMPRMRRRGRGDLLVEVIVDVPTRLTAEQESALRTYARAAEEEPTPPKRRRRGV